METMILHMDQIDFNDSRISKGFSTGGTLYVSVGDTFFPEESWYDMIWEDLHTWLPGIISFAGNHTDSCVLDFMDGPYQVKFMRRGDGSVGVICSRNQTEEISCDIDFPIFARSVIQCLRKYDRMLFENGKPLTFSEECRKLKSLI